MTASQANCDPDSDKVLLHTVLMSNGIHTDVPRTDGSHWIYDRHYGPYALWRTVRGKSSASVTTLWSVVQLLALLTSSPTWSGISIAVPFTFAWQATLSFLSLVLKRQDDYDRPQQVEKSSFPTVHHQNAEKTVGRSRKQRLIPQNRPRPS